MHGTDYLFTLFESIGGRRYEVDNLGQLEGVGRFPLVEFTKTVQGRTLPACDRTISLDNYLYRPHQEY
ncbi:hypothetical protein O9992_09060 [Vibrio lentus]|nr:hypothetical protein [Vibrio lentus]